MSIDRCQQCGDLVDTDDEPEAYVQIRAPGGYEDVCLCRQHREDHEAEMEAERKEPPGLDAFIAECIAVEPRYSCDKCDWDVDGCSPCPAHEDL